MGKHLPPAFLTCLVLIAIAPIAMGQAVVKLSATSLNFGTITAGDMTAGQVVTLTNTGNEDLDITQLAAGPPYQVFNDCASTVAPHASCNFGVVFQPQTAGTFPYAVSIVDNAAGSPQRVTLTGAAIAPVVGLSPDSLSFASQTVGTSSPVQAVSLTNKGTTTLTISSITATGDYSQTHTCTGTLAAGKNCTISVTFTPTTTGSRGGTIVVQTAGNSSQNVLLIGTAASGTASLSATSLSFGNQTLWTTSSSQKLTLTNTASAPLRILDVVATGDYAQTNTCGSSLAATANCTITVTFTPGATGARDGDITISDSDPRNLQTVTLSGSGTNPTTTVTVTPGFASATHIQTVQYTATISGVESTDVTWSVDGITGGNSTVGTISTSGLYTPPATSGVHTIKAVNADKTERGIARVVATAFPGIFTNHNDVGRTGQNLKEVVLTTGNVNNTQFGKLFSYALDGYAFAQPLYVPAVSIPGQGTHNVVYVATENDSVYAFDANNHPTTPLWHTSFIDASAGITTVPASAVTDSGCGSPLGPQVGITGTPVIDPVAQQLFVVVRTLENGNYVQRLHALNITTGGEISGSPVVIQGSVPGAGEGSYGTGSIAFSPLLENSRPGILLLNGVVYLAFSSVCDKRPYHGWVLGYNESTLAQVSVFNTSPNGIATGIWQSGNGLVADEFNNIYFATGNGWFDADHGGLDYGDTVMKMSTTSNVLSVADYFTPSDQNNLNYNDLDMGSGGCLALPDQPQAPMYLLTCVGKEGNIYLLNRNNMGHFNTDGDTQVLQTMMIGMVWGSPAYYRNQVYYWGDGDYLRQYRLYNSRLSATPVAEDSLASGYPAPTPTVSANGPQNGIVWVVFTSNFQTGGAAILRAYDAANVSRLLFDSSGSSADRAGPAVKFVVPTVADGHVYVGTQSELDVYGILP
jgi:hypothetical protein